MAPTLDIGTLTIDAYRLWRGTAVVIFIIGLILRMRFGRWPVTGLHVLLFIPFLQVGLLVGALLDENLPYLVDHLVLGAPLPPVWWGGQGWLGALGGAILAGYLFCRFNRLPAGRCFDLFAIPLPLAIAVARVGCLVNGCCYGQETTSWLGLNLPDVYGYWATRYPTQWASIIANLLIFFALVIMEHRGNVIGRHRFDGYLFSLFVVLHFGQRFVFEFWRADTHTWVGMFTWPQLYAMIGIAIALWVIIRRIVIRRIIIKS